MIERAKEAICNMCRNSSFFLVEAFHACEGFSFSHRTPYSLGVFSVPPFHLNSNQKYWKVRDKDIEGMKGATEVVHMVLSDSGIGRSGDEETVTRGEWFELSLVSTSFLHQK